MDITSPEALTWLDISDQAVRLRRVTVPVAAIAERTALDAPAVDDALASIGVVGLVSSWCAGGSTVATLTPLAALRLGLKLRRVSGGMAGLAWMPAGMPDRRDRLRRGATVREAELGTALDGLPGGEARPELYAMAREAIEGMAPAPRPRLADHQLNPNNLPRPTVGLMGCQPWPIGWRDRCYVRPVDPKRRRSRLVACDLDPLSRPHCACPACHDRPIRSAAFYCLACDRWGLDWLLRRIFEAESRAVAVRAEAKSFAERMAPAAVASA